jgi:hypothetical protein
MKNAVVIASLLIVGAGAAYSTRAEATSIGASIGYGTAGGDPNAFGLGFLGRVGFTLPLNIYAGANFVYHLGSSNENAVTKDSQNAWYAGGEVGYDFLEDDFALRPYVGLGGLVLSSQVCPAGICKNLPYTTSVYVAPGVYGQYDLGPIYVGAEVRYVIVTAKTGLNSFGFFGSLGVNL